MSGHLRANLWLLGLTLLLCCVLYPLTLWAIGQTPLFHDNAEGSLVYDKDGKVVGSLLIAQPFANDEHFWPRPSATSPYGYNAAASSASNWGASQPLLRDRVARALGPIVVYASGPKKGQLVGPDIDSWFAKGPGRRQRKGHYHDLGEKQSHDCAKLDQIGGGSADQRIRGQMDSSPS